MRSHCTETLEDIPYRLVADCIAQVGEGAHDAIVAPGTIVLGHADNQGLQHRVNFWTAWRPALLRAVKLLCDQFAVPGENGVRSDDGRYFRPCLSAQLLAYLSERLRLSVSQAYPTRHLLAEHAILYHQMSMGGELDRNQDEDGR